MSGQINVNVNVKVNSLVYASLLGVDMTVGEVRKLKFRKERKRFDKFV